MSENHNDPFYIDQDIFKKLPYLIEEEKKRINNLITKSTSIPIEKQLIRFNY